MKTSSPALRFMIVSLLAGLAAGCASARAVRRADGSGPLVTAAYEEVYVTGSHIPILVPKDPNIRRLPTTSPVTTLSPEDFQRMLGPGVSPMH